MILMKGYVFLTTAAMKMGKIHFYRLLLPSGSEFMAFFKNDKLMMIEGGWPNATFC